MLAPWKERYDELRQCVEKQRHHFANKRPHSQNDGASWITQRVKNPPAIKETQVQSLCRKDPLGKEMETYSSLLA